MGSVFSSVAGVDLSHALSWGHESWQIASEVRPFVQGPSLLAVTSSHIGRILQIHVYV